VYQVVYSSLAKDVSLPDGELQSMLTTFRTKNLRLGISGILLHSYGRFLQMMEGDKDTIDGLYARIEKDPRHYDLFRHNLTFPRRLFTDWSMAFVNFDAKTNLIPGFAGRTPGIDLHSIDATMIAELLDHFSDELSAKQKANAQRA
jgi:hypothetical protein